MRNLKWQFKCTIISKTFWSGDESKSGADEQTTQVISQLQQEVYELKTRLVNLEKMTGFTPDIAI